jgi:hypothetical protein
LLVSDGVSSSNTLGRVPPAYQHCRHIWLDNLRLAIATNESLPHLVAWWCFVLLDHDEQRAVPPRHAIGLFIPEDQVLEIVLFIASIVVCVGQKLLVVFATAIRWRSYVQL